MPNPKINQRAPTQAVNLPNSTCDSTLFTRLDQLGEIDPAIAWGPVRAVLGFAPAGVAGPNIVLTGPIWSIVRGGWVENVWRSFGPNDEDNNLPFLWRNTVIVAKTILVNLFLALTWVACLLAEVWVSRIKGPGSCLAKGVKTLKADIQAKELVGLLTAASSEYATRVDYLGMNYLCPSKIPDVATAVAGFMADSIDAQTLNDYCRANGYCEQTVWIQTQAARSRFNDHDLAELRHRGWLNDVSYDDGLRANGWLGKPERDTAWLLTFWYPEPAVSMDWARRRILDQSWIDQAGLDQDWPRISQSEAVNWLKGKGVTDDDQKRMLRASYRMLDPSTAFDLYRRWLAGFLAPGTKFDQSDLARALEMSDVPPAYRDVYKTVAFSPLGFRQLRTLYDESLVDDDYAARAMVASGFAPNDANLIVAEWAKLKPAYFRKKIGAGGAAQYGKDFAEGFIGTREFLQELQAEGFTPDEAQAALTEARAERIRLSRRELIKFLKTRYLRGEVNEVQLQDVLLSLGLDTEDVAELMRTWRAEFELHPRQVSASQLVAWYKSGLLSGTDLAAALAQLRYSAADSARIVATADYESMADNVKRAEKILAGAEKSLRADDKEWRSVLNQVEKQAGALSQRTLTEPGKLLSWIEKRVTKVQKSVRQSLEKGAAVPDGATAAPTDDDAAFVEPTLAVAQTRAPPASNS